MAWDNDYKRDRQEGYDDGLEAGQVERDALASTVTRQRSEIDTLREELDKWRAVFARFEGKTLTLADIPGLGKFWDVTP